MVHMDIRLETEGERNVKMTEQTKEDFIPCIRVKAEDGRIGVVCAPFPSVDYENSEKVYVVYAGEIAPDEVNWRELEIVGYEIARASFEKCDNGKGSNACRFFINHPKEGSQCHRYSYLRWTLIFLEEDKRNPPEPYPHCQPG